jgi:hypothetical protein
MSKLIAKMIDLGFWQDIDEPGCEVWTGSGSRYQEVIDVLITGDGSITMTKTIEDDPDTPTTHVTWSRYDDAMIDVLEWWAR